MCCYMCTQLKWINSWKLWKESKVVHKNQTKNEIRKVLMKPLRSTFFLKLTQSIPARYLSFLEAAVSDAVLSTLFVHPQLRGKPDWRCQPCCKRGTSSAVVKHFGRRLGPGPREKGKPKTWPQHGHAQRVLPPALWPGLMPEGWGKPPWCVEADFN